MFAEFGFHVLSIGFLMVCFVRLERFVASLDIVLVTIRTAEIANTVGFQRLGGRMPVVVYNIHHRSVVFIYL